MSSGYASPFSTTDCMHANVVEDMHEGTIVCRECAYVIHENVEYIQISNEYEDDYEIRSPSQQLLYDVCSNLHITQGIYNESKEQATALMDMYQQYFPSFTWRDFTCYALYMVLKEHMYPVVPNVIAFNCQVDLHSIWKLECELSTSNVHIKPRYFASQFCNALDLDYDVERNVSQICDNLTFLDHYHPQTICASVIYTYLRSQDVDISMKHAGIKCCVSYSSISRLCRQQSFPDIDNIHEYTENKLL